MGVLNDSNISISRAQITHSAVDQHLYDRKNNLFITRRWILWKKYETLWPFAGAWAASCAFASIDAKSLEQAHLGTYINGLAEYHEDHASSLKADDPIGFKPGVVRLLSPGGDIFFDDNAWVVLALLHEYGITNDDQCLVLAQRVMRFIISGWSTDASWAHPGGIRWKQPASNMTRNTCSNAPVAEAAAELFNRTQDESWLEWSLSIYQWTRTALRNQNNLYCDHINPDGSIEPALWTYNQGTMIGVGVLLSKMTGEAKYLDDAETTANAALTHFDLSAMVLQAVPFNAVFARNLLLLDRVRPDPRYRALIASYGDEMWNKHRDATSGLFNETSRSRLNGSAPMIEIYSLLAGAKPTA